MTHVPTIEVQLVPDKLSQAQRQKASLSFFNKKQDVLCTTTTKLVITTSQ